MTFDLSLQYVCHICVIECGLHALYMYDTNAAASLSLKFSSQSRNYMLCRVWHHAARVGHVSPSSRFRVPHTVKVHTFLLRRDTTIASETLH